MLEERRLDEKGLTSWKKTYSKGLQGREKASKYRKTWQGCGWKTSCRREKKEWEKNNRANDSTKCVCKSDLTVVGDDDVLVVLHHVDKEAQALGIFL